MVRWEDLEARVPDLAAAIRERFQAHRHHTLATLRKDGAPRISGTEVGFADGDISLGMMPGSVKALDLQRDPRMAVHSHSEDPPEDLAEANRWSGDAKLAGRAVAIPRPDTPGPPGSFFRIDIEEAVVTRVGTPPDHLVIESWHEDIGYRRRERR